MTSTIYIKPQIVKKTYEAFAESISKNDFVKGAGLVDRLQKYCSDALGVTKPDDSLDASYFLKSPPRTVVGLREGLNKLHDMIYSRSKDELGTYRRKDELHAAIYTAVDAAREAFISQLDNSENHSYSPIDPEAIKASRGTGKRAKS